MAVSYLRKLNKNLRLIKIIKETYQRSSVPCGFKCCTPIPLKLKSIKETRPRIMIPSSYIIDNYLPLLESNFINCIIPYTELNFRTKRILKDKYFIFRNDLVGMDIYKMCDFYIFHTNLCFEVLDENNIEELPKRYTNSDEIYDLISRPVSERFNFKKHVKSDKVGLFIGNNYDGSGVVYLENEKIEISKGNTNRALSGDKVYIKGNEIVGIYERCRNPLSGVIIPDSGIENVLVRPLQKNYPLIRIHTKQLDILKNQRILVSIEGWLRNSKYPFGNYLRRIGEVGDIETEINSILIRNKINLDDYEGYDEIYSKYLDENNNVIYNGNIFEIPGIETADSPIPLNIDKLFENEDENRVDFRNKFIFSIDPPGCTDVDDALHIEKTYYGYEVGVHIADVSNYIEIDSELDKIAKNKGTTTYLVDRRIEMLPSILSSNLCSLIENVDRLAFSVIFKFNNNFDIFEYIICKSIIKNRKNLTYEEALKTNDLKLKPLISALMKISKKLRKERMDRGALNIANDEYKFEYLTKNYSNNKSIKVKMLIKKSLETNKLIEEFMILTNVIVAKILYKNIPEIALLRKHPKSEIFNPNTDNINFNNRIISKNMFPASYCTGNNDDFFHYGLATNFYTHFTSPIRRYADLIVHRLLKMIMKINKKEYILINNENEFKFKNNFIWNQNYFKYSPLMIEKICDLINERNRNSKNASRECIRIFMYLYLRDIKKVIDGMIMEILDNGIVVYLPEYDIDGYIENNEWKYSKDGVYFKGKMIYKLYDYLNVRIERDDELFFLNNKFNIVLV